MKPVYALEAFPSEVTQTLFLAGPTPRGAGHSWRSDALKVLEQLGYDGHVFIPEPRSGDWVKHYDDQVEWEEEGLHRADCIVFWVPRDMTGEVYGCPMPGLTTNIEWGFWKTSGKVVWGSPDEASSVRYPRYYAHKYNAPVCDTMVSTLIAAMQMIGDGARRVEGECDVPLHVWRKPEFQDWYRKLVSAGNRLDGGRVLWSSWSRNGLFGYVFKPNIYISKEDRSTFAEWVLFRTDVSHVVLHGLNDQGIPAVVLVKEFRVACRNEAGYTYTLPGGSGPEGEDPLLVAVHEVHEEVGLEIELSRFKPVGSRQQASSLTAYKASIFSVELTPTELNQLAKDKSVHGIEEDGERTFIEVVTIDQLSTKLVDWSTLGMVLNVINQ